ncbi:pyruvate ferredoxin oxidoreductase [Marinisporobacter balticus]|uniref:Pyruvate ferredoxin oxidoreductase alpha subunit n=1 Tax=Marinisporobacter balticus TaxID=2018667 RepID=A0A4R2KAP0_9FIRM|nr:pyruvate ferredoxin oxidoreductase [Marinisporobacter balticus]TCO69252.1 pyruvate ferredoxin oxidoreductase alpha subunit [Marinisporobacter balticus]
MAIRESLSGNEAIALAMKQINPDVLPAFPITPSTEIPQYFSQYVADGLVDTEFVTVESEHSAMSACIGSQAAGARTFTATSSCGLALMFEMLYVAASSRLPITIACVNRALTGPININADHSDTMGARDSGWIQLYSENNQEAYDNFIQAVRIGEHKDVMLPVMVCQDGFITSHAVENLELLEDEVVKKFTGEYEPEDFLLNVQRPIAVGPYDTANFYMEHKRQQAEAMSNAKKVILEVAEAYKKLTGRNYGFFEEYRMEDAEAALVIINSTAGTAKEAIDKMRMEGKKVGLIKIRVFRPFPFDEIKSALQNVTAIAVMDRCEGFSAAGGPLFVEVRSAMYDSLKRPSMVNYIYGLGGRDVRVEDIETVYNDLFKIIESEAVGQIYRYLSVRE